MPHLAIQKSGFTLVPALCRAKGVRIDVIALATSFSPKGYLYKEERKFGCKVLESEEWKANPVTFALTRLL